MLCVYRSLVQRLFAALDKKTGSVIKVRQMKKDKVIKHYGSAANAARALGISRQAIEQWPETVPYLRACHIQVATKGKLKVDPRRYAA